MKLGVMLPLLGPFAQDEKTRIDQALTLGYSTLWLQEWPVGSGPEGHIDHGTGYDPLLYALHLGNVCGSHLDTIGFAVLRLDYRPAAVTARAIVSADALGRKPLLLGLGAKTDTTERVEAAAATWRSIRSYLYSKSEPDAFVLPPNFSPPPMYSASSNPLFWEAINYKAEGWLTNRIIPQQIQEKADLLRPHVSHLSIILQIFCYLDLHDDNRLEMGQGMPLHIGRSRLRELVHHWSAVGVERLIYVPSQTATLDQLRAFAEIVGGNP